MKYTDENRGKIQFTKRRNQINDFSNLRYGKITATDTDGEFDIEGKLFFKYEIKFGDAEMPSGQYKHFIYETACLHRGGANAIVLEIRHNVEDVNKEVDVAPCIVDRYCLNGKWYKPRNKNSTAKEATDFFIKHYMPEKAKEFGIV